jgi:hypothetical protein
VAISFWGEYAAPFKLVKKVVDVGTTDEDGRYELTFSQNEKRAAMVSAIVCTLAFAMKK